MNAIASIPEQTDAVFRSKEARISKRMRKVLSLLATRGMTQRDAAKQAGMSETYLSTALKKPGITGVYRAARCVKTIAIGGLRASARLVELIDAGSEHVSADGPRNTHSPLPASNRPLTRKWSVNIDIKAGYVIDLTDTSKSVTDATG